MDPIGFRGPTAPNPEQIERQRYTRSLRILDDLLGARINSVIDPKTLPPAFDAYFTVKKGMAKGIIPENIYNQDDLKMMRKILDTAYLPASTQLARPSGLEDYFREQSRKHPDHELPRMVANDIGKVREQLRTMRTIDELDNPESDATRRVLGNYFNIPKKQ